ncbi:MAG: histidinol phosphate phosphatase, partial [Erysipelotrichaceae bacterium]|nr:histidinol phosphate phosphatase [Erysipelotrichaceae bacterium]
DYSVLGHLDYINRHDRVHVPFETDRDDIAEVLKLAIKDGKGIEVNTSSYRYGIGEWTPAREVFELYRDLGGRIITLGSDSHKPEHLGAHIKEKMEVLKDMGIREFCTFEDMKPVFHQL